MQEKMRNISPIKKRILQYLEIKGISKYVFYKKTGISRGVLDKDSGLSEDSIAKTIAYYSDISPSWLLTGEGDMLSDQNYTYYKPGKDEENPECKEVSIYKRLLSEKENQVSLLNREIGQLQKELDLFKKDNQSSDMHIPAESKLRFRDSNKT